MLLRPGNGGTESVADVPPLLTKSDQLPEVDRNMFRMLGRLPCFCGEGTRLSGGDVKLGAMAENDDRDVG